MRKVWGSAFAGASLLLVASSARADGVGFAVDHFDPSERGSEWFALDSLDLRGHERVAAGLVGDYAYHPLIATDSANNYITALVRHQAVVHAGASLVLWDRLRVAADVPVQVFANGSAAIIDGVPYAPPAHATSLGDLRLSGDVRLLGVHGEPFTLAAGVEVFVPTGDQASYASDGTVRLMPRLLAAGDLGPFVYAAKAGTTVRALSTSYGPSRVGTDVLVAASAGVRLVDGRLVVGPEVFGNSVVLDGAFLSKRATPFEAMLGAHYMATDVLRVGAGVSTGLTGGYGTPDVRIVALVEWAPAFKAPAPPPPPPVVPAPAPPPPPPAPADRDHDGVPDDADACPDVAGVASPDPKTNGCPPPPPPPPPPADRDGDGIVDDQDACPDEPGKPDPDPKRNGCPQAFVQNGEIKILDQVKFATGRAEIVAGPEGAGVLEAVLGVLHAHPDIQKLRVEGHTDDRGTPAANKTLSAARAAAVASWLRQHGVEASRLTSAGFGQDRPVDTNATEAGRKNNRRVEFHIEAGSAQ